MIHSHSKCEICGEQARHECRVCGRIICSEHYDEEREICSICSMSMCEICGERLAIGYCSICGRLGCDECLVQIDPSRWICRDCARQSFLPISDLLCRPSSKLARSIWG